jgi:hypothetical protein
MGKKSPSFQPFAATREAIRKEWHGSELSALAILRAAGRPLKDVLANTHSGCLAS